MRGEKLRTSEVFRPITKLLIAQRGISALRAAKVCEKRGIPAVIPYTFSDSNPLASRLAETHLQDGWELAALGGTRQEENYTDGKKLIQTAKLHGCDAIFLGYGFLSEDAGFAKMCQSEGLRILAQPSPAVMELTGNKIKAREAAKRVKIGRWSTIPVIEGSENLRNFEQASTVAEKLGYPVIVKDPDQGGGMGNVVARNPKELENAFTTLKGRPDNRQLFMERLIQNAAHVEVQIAADKYGNVVALGERDCTLQRDNQKVIEESPSPHISAGLRSLLQTAAVRFAKAVNYKGIGTWEFLVDLDRIGKEGDPAWYFMEVNPRLQVEHGVTEEQIGADIVDLMFDIEEGKPLPFTQDQIKPKGHTMEARFYAENPDKNFEKSAGPLTVLRYPEIGGVRVDKAVEEGDSMSPWYDNSIALIMAHGPDRETARQKLLRVLYGIEAVGPSNNLPFLTELINSDEFRDGQTTTQFAEERWRQRLKDRVHSIADFINGGTFITYPPSKHFNPALMPPTSTVISRRNESNVTYSDHLKRLQQEKGAVCSAQYGILEREGVRFVVYSLDFNINAGSMGVQEGNMLVDAAELAYKQALPLVTLCSTAGIDNWTNTPGLHQMGHTVAALTKKYPPKFHINIFHGFALGGPPAGPMGSADLQIMVDSADSKTGFSGIPLVAKQAGIMFPENMKAADIYKALAEHDPKYEGLHSVQRHYENRTVDVYIGSLAEASDKVVRLIRNLGIDSATTDKTRVFQSHEQIALREGPTDAARFDRQGRYRFWFGSSRHIDEILKRIGVSERDETQQPLTNYDIWKLVYNPYRPTAADLLDPRLGMFDDTVLLSGLPQHFGDGVELYPPIIAATAKINDLHMLVLAQQTQRVKDELTGRLVKRYHPPRPQDWEYALRKLGLGGKNGLPVLYMGDIEGADCSADAEDRGQILKIPEFLKMSFSYPFPSAAILLGVKGSGGGETFFRPFDAAAAARNTLAFVADPRTKNWIQGGHWLTDSTEEFARYINGEQTARPEAMLDMGLIDHIIEEGPGGAHKNPQLFAVNARNWVYSELVRLQLFSQSHLEKLRWERSERVGNYFNI